MSEPTFLTRVVLENYKSITACDVRLGPLTFLVGPNAAGKSNFLDALHFVADALANSVDYALRTRGGGDRIAYSPSPSHSPSAFGIRLEFSLPSGWQGHYAVRLGRRDERSLTAPWEVLDEEGEVCKDEDNRAPPRFRFRRHVDEPNSQPARPWVDNRLVLSSWGSGRPGDAEAFRPVYEALTGMRFYQILPRSIEDVQTVEPGTLLQGNGSDLASVLLRLRRSETNPLDRINEYLRSILPGLVKVRVEPVFQERPNLSPDGARIALLFEQVLPGKGVQLFWPSQMSDGTLRGLGILVALLQAAAQDGPPLTLVGIEEPEAQIHPAALAVLLDAMREASHLTQVLVTTHSPDLLDNREVPTEAVLAVTAEGGQTRIGPIDEASRSVLRQHLFTVGELLRLNQLAPEGNGAETSAGEGVRLFDSEA
jgi:predicted ATPase